MGQRVKGLHFVVQKPDGRSTTYEITKLTTTIGRDETNDLTISVNTISRKHAEFTIDQKSKKIYSIEDMGSSNGTRVNGEVVAGVRALKLGDEITLSNIVSLQLKYGFFEREFDLDQTQPILVDEIRQALEVKGVTGSLAGTASALVATTTYELELIPTKEAYPSEVRTDDAVPPGFLFISHSSKDVVMARRISQQLKKDNIETWLDVERLKVGAHWKSKIKKAMNESWGVLILMSRHAMNSLECEGERQFFERAYQDGEKQIYCLLLEDMPPDELPYTIPVIQYINLGQDYDDGMEQLKTAIMEDHKHFPLNKPHPAIFISHSYTPEDRKALQAVQKILKSREVSVWDHVNAPAPGTVAWKQAVPTAIAESQCVIVVISPDSEKSKWAAYEIEQAIQQDKIIIGLYVRNSNLSVFAKHVDVQINCNTKDAAMEGMTQLLTQLKMIGIGG